MRPVFVHQPARRDRRCHACNVVIPAGSRHLAVYYRDGDTMKRADLCSSCLQEVAQVDRFGIPSRHPGHELTAGEIEIARTREVKL